MERRTKRELQKRMFSQRLPHTHAHMHTRMHTRTYDPCSTFVKVTNFLEFEEDDIALLLCDGVDVYQRLRVHCESL